MIEDAFMQSKYNRVMNDTWGHLKPTNKKYSGYILIYYAYSGEYGILDWYFGEVEGNPWTEEWMQLYVDTKIMKLKHGNIYKLSGTLTVLKNEKHRFNCTIRKLKLV